MGSPCKCIDCSDWNSTSYDRRQFRQNHGGGPEVIPQKSLKKAKNKNKKRKKDVCPDNGAHVYVWIKENVIWHKTWLSDTEYSYFLYHRVCIGCGKRQAGWRHRYNGQEIYQETNRNL